MQPYICNLMTSIKNGQLAKKKIIFHEKKKIGESILKILWNEGFILGYSIKNIKLQIFLKYSLEGEPVIKSTLFVSKPGKKIYFSSKQIWKINVSKTFVIFSTHKGLKSIYECKKGNFGGEPFLVIK